MCVTFTSEIITTDKDIIAYKICSLDKGKFYSELEPHKRWYQNKESTEDGTYLEYKIGHQNISSFDNTSGIYLFKRCLHNLHHIKNQYISRNKIILKVLVPKNTKIRYGKFGWNNYITINAEKIIPLYSMPIY